MPSLTEHVGVGVPSWTEDVGVGVPSWTEHVVVVVPSAAAMQTVVLSFESNFPCVEKPPAFRTHEDILDMVSHGGVTTIARDNECNTKTTH